jgi:hypothetical protein
MVMKINFYAAENGKAVCLWFVVLWFVVATALWDYLKISTIKNLRQPESVQRFRPEEQQTTNHKLQTILCY